jgi:hypothetical protein
MTWKNRLLFVLAMAGAVFLLLTISWVRFQNAVVPADAQPATLARAVLPIAFLLCIGYQITRLMDRLTAKDSGWLALGLGGLLNRIAQVNASRELFNIGQSLGAVALLMLALSLLIDRPPVQKPQ